MIDKYDKIEPGDELIINCHIFGQDGNTKFNKGDKVTVREVVMSKGYWSTLCPDVYHKPEIRAIKINESTGSWRLDTFSKISIE